MVPLEKVGRSGAFRGEGRSQYDISRVRQPDGEVTGENLAEFCLKAKI
jgi:hypothetical protein